MMSGLQHSAAVSLNRSPQAATTHTVGGRSSDNGRTPLMSEIGPASVGSSSGVLAAPTSSLRGTGPYPVRQGLLTLGAYLLMVAGQIPGIATQSIPKVSKVYEFIGVPPGQAFAIWGFIFTLELVYVILTLVWRGDATSGAGGHPTDLASLNHKLQTPIRSVMIMQGIWSLLYNFVDIDYPPTTPDSGKSGIARGSALDRFDPAFWACSMLLFAIAGTFYYIAYGVQQASANIKPGRGAKEIFVAMTGIMMNTGWVTAASSFIPNQITLALTKQGDSGNHAMQVAAFATLISAVFITLAPVVAPTVNGKLKVV